MDDGGELTLVNFKNSPWLFVLARKWTSSLRWIPKIENQGASTEFWHARLLDCHFKRDDFPLEPQRINFWVGHMEFRRGDRLPSYTEEYLQDPNRVDSVDPWRGPVAAP